MTLPDLALWVTTLAAAGGLPLALRALTAHDRHYAHQLKERS
jgi:hypothetical protein